MAININDLLSRLQQSMKVGMHFSILALLQLAVILYRPDIVDKENRVNPVHPAEIAKVYDYIVVGAGSAGCVVANRLSENPKRTVLLLEAGENEPALTDLPGMYENNLAADSPLDWRFRTEQSDKYCLSSKNRQCQYSRGKVLGGSSVINGMVYVRGHYKDFNGWAAQGNPGWDWNSVLTYFKKLEDMAIPEYADSPLHSTGGYQTLGRYRFRTLVVEYVVKALLETGMKMTDYNDGNQTGVSYTAATVRDGLRCSTAKAYLRPASKRKNLHVSVNSMVNRVLIDKQTKTAYGVEFTIGDKVHRVMARREVILSAGAIQSPQLLLLSGVGPKEDLDELGIDVVLDSPGVGQNFQDHVVFPTMLYSVDLSLDDLKEPTPPGEPPLIVATNNAENFTPKSIKQLVTTHDGPLYTTVTAEVMSFNNTKYFNESDPFPDIQMYWGSRTQYADDGTARIFYYGIPIGTRPLSTGYLKLRSNDSNVQPVIVPNYLQEPQDLNVAVEGWKLIHSLKDTKTLRELNATAHLNTAPDCEEYEYESEDYWRCQVRYYSLPGLHASGTCKMGPATDELAVVDPRLRVHGISNLRVIDASIMPFVVSGNANGAIIMIGEKGSDLIKEDWEAEE